MQRIPLTKWMVVSIGIGMCLGSLTARASAQICAALGLPAPCISSNDIGNRTVQSSHIRNGAVRSRHIRDNTVRSSDIRDNSLTAMDLAPDSVGTSEIATGAVGSDEVAHNSLTNLDLARNSVRGVEIAANAVNTDEVENNSLSARDLRNEAGADFTGGGQNLSLEGRTTVRSVVVTAPSSGVVIVNVSGVFVFDSTTVTCSITKGTTIEADHSFAASDPDFGSRSFAATRGFTTESGSTTFRLVCTRDDFSNVLIRNTHMTALFFPTRY